MSLFNRALRPPPTVSDEAVERYLVKLSAEVEPDPLFGRRLRSHAVNRFVAAREGIHNPVREGLGRRQIGRIGRACLYASFTLGVSAASVMAASQEALPGDPLYALKQRIEELRWEVVPAQLHGELAAYALGERIEEMGRLAEAGRLDAAIAMAPAIDREYQRLVALGQTDDAARTARIERHVLVLQGLVEQLPATARAAVQIVIEPAPGTDRGPSSSKAGGVNPPANGGAGNGAGQGAPSVPDATPRPEQSPRPDPTARPDPSPKPGQLRRAESSPPGSGPSD